MNSRRENLRSIASQYRSPEDRARRIFLEEPSFALEGKKDVEFQIKTSISRQYQIPYRSVLFCGSAHLGFSAIKDRDFVPGSSDLDVAIVHMDVFQERWRALVETTKAFTDLMSFHIHKRPNDKALLVRDLMVKRGLLHLHDMPSCPVFNGDRKFFDRLSVQNRTMFGNISVSFYMSEYAFCWKQASSISAMIAG
jgi:hypothetical protein